MASKLLTLCSFSFPLTSPSAAGTLCKHELFFYLSKPLYYRNLSSRQMTPTLAKKTSWASQLSRLLQYSVLLLIVSYITLKPRGSFNRDYGNPGTYGPTPHIVTIQFVLIKPPASASGPLLHNQLHMSEFIFFFFYTLYNKSLRQAHRGIALSMQTRPVFNNTGHKCH